MGFTLRAALAALGPDAQADRRRAGAFEIIAWAKGPMAELAAGCLDDPRVAVVLDDVAARRSAGRARPTTRSCSMSTTAQTG